MITRILILTALALGGCATAAPPKVDPTDIAKPLPVLMEPQLPQIPVPDAPCEGDPNCRASTYYGPHRAQCGGYRDTAIGLQTYVKTLHGAKR